MLFKPSSYIKKLKNFNPNVLIHCAWYEIPKLSKKNSLLNFKYSKELINRIINLKTIDKIIVAGSCFEIKNKSKKVSEKCKLDESTYFSMAKVKLLNYLKKKVKKNQKYFWLRIFYAYGPGNRKSTIIPTIIRNLRKNKPFVINSPRNKLDYIYIDDVANYFIKILKKNPNSGIYNVASGKLSSIKFIFYFLKSKINKNYKFKVFKKSNKILNYYGSDEKTIKNLSWKPKLDIKSGLSKTIRYL